MQKGRGDECEHSASRESGGVAEGAPDGAEHQARRERAEALHRRVPAERHAALRGGRQIGDESFFALSANPK